MKLHTVLAVWCKLNSKCIVRQFHVLLCRVSPEKWERMAEQVNQENL